MNIDAEKLIHKIELYDYSGKKILQKSLQAMSASINLQTLNRGIYILKVFNASGINIVKVSVVK